MMKTILPKIIGCLLLFSGTFAQPIHRIDGSTIASDSLNATIHQLMDEAKVSGLAISVFNQNKPVYTQAFGLSNVPGQISFTGDQVLYAASFSKAVFAYICAQLLQEKVFELDRPLVQYLPKPLVDYKIPGYRRGYADLRGDKRLDKITARMCLDHTTGFPNWRWFEADKKIKFIFDPGTRYSYSGEGLYLLQFVIEQITGKDYESIARERVFIPLGMTQTSYVWHDDYASHLVLGHNSEGKPYEFMHWKEAGCAGTLCSTFDDYTKFFTALMQHRRLSKSAFNRMIHPQVRIRSIKQFGPQARQDSTLNDDIQLGYGLGLGVFRTPHGRAFFKEGHDDGWGHYSVAYPDFGIGVVIMTNSDNGEKIIRRLLKASIGDVYTPSDWEDYP